MASSAPIPTPTTTPIGVESNNVQLNCINDAKFLEDLTIPDQTIVEASQTLDKRWSVQNSGSCDWGPGYRLVHVSRDDFQADESIALYPARAGAVAVWQVAMSAPFEPGEHIGFWQASSPEGELFGEQVYLWVIVSTPTPVPTSRGTPTN
jgi:next-to-BRCA1 protein 1